MHFCLVQKLSRMSVGWGVDLKKEEEVQEYIKNLGIEYRFGCYHEKDPKGRERSLNLVLNEKCI